MSKLFGVDVKALVNKHIAPGLMAATLVREVKGQRSAQLTAGRASTPVTYPCRGIWTGMVAKDGETEVLGKDRKAMLVGLDIVPQGGDVVTIDGESQVVVKVLDRDPVGATVTIQCADRKAASA